MHISHTSGYLRGLLRGTLNRLECKWRCTYSCKPPLSSIWAFVSYIFFCNPFDRGRRHLTASAARWKASLLLAPPPQWRLQTIPAPRWRPRLRRLWCFLRWCGDGRWELFSGISLSILRHHREAFWFFYFFWNFVFGDWFIHKFMLPSFSTPSFGILNLVFNIRKNVTISFFFVTLLKIKNPKFVTKVENSYFQ